MLITLGIIGVVAALTLPNLVDGYYKVVAEARLKKFYSVFNQAIVLSEAKNGPKESWYQDVRGVEFDDEGNAITETSEIDKWFSKYLGDFIVIKKKAKTNGMMVYYLNDGSQFVIGSHNPGQQFYSARDIFFYPFGNFENCTVDNNWGGSGSCQFVFNFYPICSNYSSNCTYLKGKGLEPYLWNWDGNYSTLIGSGYSGCNPNSDNKGVFCTAVVQMNGWKFPKNYPFKVHP